VLPAHPAGVRSSLTLARVRRQQLSHDELADLARLEERINDRDHIQLKLEWPSLREGRTVAALTHRVGGELVGFIGAYSFGGPPEVELTGMVDPDHRRQGIAATLLDRARVICDDEGLTERLGVVPRTSVAGAALVRGRGGVIDHSEHSMVLTAAPRRVDEDPAVTLRLATPADQRDLLRIFTAGFGPPPPEMLAQLHSDVRQTLIVEHARQPIGALRVLLDDRGGGIFGFAIDTEWRGRGIGRDVLGRACSQLRARGAAKVELQVAVENDNALHLYTSTGFERVSTEDYYRLP
jgi:ribosomal protein S18 acetylase RimI-like enzyme